MTVAKETRFSFFRIVTYLHNKTNVCCTRMKISFFSYIYIFTYLHIYIFTYLHIYKTKTFSCTDTFTKQKASDVLIYLQNQKTLEEGVKRQIVCIRIGMCSVCTCNVHVHTHQGMYKNLGGRSQTADCCRRSRTPPVGKGFGFRV